MFVFGVPLNYCLSVGVVVTLVTCEPFINSSATSAVELVSVSDCILAGVRYVANHLFKFIFAVVWASYSSCAHGLPLRTC